MTASTTQALETKKQYSIILVAKNKGRKHPKHRPEQRKQEYSIRPVAKTRNIKIPKTGLGGEKNNIPLDQLQKQRMSKIEAADQQKNIEKISKTRRLSYFTHFSV